MTFTAGKRWQCMLINLTVSLLIGGCGQNVAPTPAASQATGSTLCFADYQRCVDPIFHNVIHAQNGTISCTQGSGCHLAPNPSGGQFQLDPNAQSDSMEMHNNFTTALQFVNFSNPSESFLLLKPSVAGRVAGVGHAGGNVFPTETDACYVTIKTWISTQVDDENSPSCGSCTAPTISSCGY